jgi:hypothetical protein
LRFPRARPFDRPALLSTAAARAARARAQLCQLKQQQVARLAPSFGFCRAWFPAVGHFSAKRRGQRLFERPKQRLRVHRQRAERVLPPRVRHASSQSLLLFQCAIRWFIFHYHNLSPAPFRLAFPRMMLQCGQHLPPDGPLRPLPGIRSCCRFYVSFVVAKAGLTLSIFDLESASATWMTPPPLLLSLGQHLRANRKHDHLFLLPSM